MILSLLPLWTCKIGRVIYCLQNWKLYLYFGAAARQNFRQQIWIAANNTTTIANNAWRDTTMTANKLDVIIIYSILYKNLWPRRVFHSAKVPVPIFDCRFSVPVLLPRTCGIDNRPTTIKLLWSTTNKCLWSLPVVSSPTDFSIKPFFQTGCSK